MAPAEVLYGWRDRLERSRELLDEPECVWQRWQQWLDDSTFWPEHSVRVHGDLHPAHILVDTQHRVTGLLDWTEAHVGDPATDVVLQFATMGERTTRALIERYVLAGGPVWPRMPEHIEEMWSAYPAVIAEFVPTTGEEAHLTLAQTLLNAHTG